MADDCRLSAYDFEYPETLVADRPAEPRDASRLVTLERASGRARHGLFRHLPSLLQAGDCLVLNRTKVRRARLEGRKPTGGKVELLLLGELGPSRWRALAQGVKPGTRVELAGGATALVEALNAEGEWECRFSTDDVLGLMRRCGLAPLPPYILKRRRGGPSPRDPEDYQTVYASEEGSVAAPTAGLHFTAGLLERLRGSGISVVELALHVGHGTFQPVAAADVRSHRMKPEWYRIEPEAARAIEERRRSGGRIVAVGTSAARALESHARTGSLEGWTDLFIRPGHDFLIVDALVTNFHQPRSTPLLLACAFAGRERLLAAYREAIARGCRLFSYGDAMLLL